MIFSHENDLRLQEFDYLCGSMQEGNRIIHIASGDKRLAYQRIT